jgi:two-component system LytT family response regulator
MDLGLLLFVLDKLRPVAGEKPTLLFELTRGSSKYFCDPTQIYLLASENYYTRLHTSEGVFVMRKSLKSYEELLPAETFLRIHRSAIVNVNQVAELARDGHGLEVVMKDGTRRRVSRNLAGEINAYFRNRAL